MANRVLRRAAVALLFVSVAAPASEILIPTATVYSVGYNGSQWGTETRVINRTATPKHFAVVDWIGSPGWSPTSYTIQPGATLSLGGGHIWNYKSGQSPGPAPYLGAAICDVDDGLLVQTAMLSGDQGTAPIALETACFSWEGGFGYNYNFCNQGAGAIVDNVSGFFPADTEIFLPWLHTDPTRRTNLMLINPDAQAASVSVTITSEDGLTSVTGQYSVGPRSVFQVNKLFDQDPWNQIRAAHRLFRAAAARASVRSDTRLYAVAFVVSNQNNTVTISLPR